HLRQAVTHKEPLEHSAHRLTAGIFHPAQLQHITRMLIADRERLAPPLRFIIPPAFEVHRPHLVRHLTTSATMQPTPLRRGPSPWLPLGQARSLQHPLETALARRSTIKSQIQLPDLARPP